MLKLNKKRKAEEAKLDAEALAEKEKKAQHEIDMELLKRDVIQQSAFDASSAVIGLLKKDSIAYKIAASAQALIATFLGITRMLGSALPPPSNFIAAASVGHVRPTRKETVPGNHPICSMKLLIHMVA